MYNKLTALNRTSLATLSCPGTFKGCLLVPYSCAPPPAGGTADGAPLRPRVIPGEQHPAPSSQAFGSSGFLPCIDFTLLPRSSCYRRVSQLQRDSGEGACQPTCKRRWPFPVTTHSISPVKSLLWGKLSRAGTEVERQKLC